jgi:hypothetical protein
MEEKDTTFERRKESDEGVAPDLYPVKETTQHTNIEESEESQSLIFDEYRRIEKHREEIRARQKRNQTYDLANDQLLNKPPHHVTIRETQEREREDKKREIRQRIDKTLNPYKKRASLSRDRQILQNGNSKMS